MDALQNALHVALQLGLFRLQPSVAMDLCNGRLVIQATHCRVDGRVLLMVRLEHVEVGWVVAGAAHCHETGSNVRACPYIYGLLLTMARTNGSYVMAIWM